MEGKRYLSLVIFLKTTEICLGPTKMDNFYREKVYFTREKIGKSDFAPSEKYSSYASGHSSPLNNPFCP